MPTEKIATRDAYGKALQKLGTENQNVVALDADLGDSTRSLLFGEEFKERYFSMGIAEQNMIGTAAGLAVSGKIVYASTFAIFSERAFEFVRNIVSRNKLNVKLAGSHAGIATGEDGKSAQAIEDIAIYRALPNMIILQPCDGIEAEKMVFWLANYKGPSYMRLQRTALPVIHSADYKFKIGKAEVLIDGADAVIFATGTMVHEAVGAQKMLAAQNVSIAVVNISTIKPLDDELIVAYAKKTKVVFTAEDHSIIGGLGSAITELLSEKYPCKIVRIGLNDTYAESGTPAQLYEKYGLSAPQIAKRVSSEFSK